jgi:crotonobetainyl-CoA:carnitine CoA-transferase CaiB-like acyl-CoA transferase
MASLYLGCNRNKRSLAIDLKHPEGRDAALEVLRGADVLLHNYRPESIERMGLDYASVQAINPAIVYCATHGYSQRGPYGGRGAYDDSVQAASGLASLQARSGGDMRYLPTIVADKTTALVAVQAILAALLYRERHGQGQQVEVPMFETMAGWVAVEHLWGHSWSPSRGGSGYPRVLSPDRRPYRARDGAWLSVLPYMDRHWAVFWDAAGHPELLGDPRFGSVADRLFHIDDCYAAIAAAIAEKDASEWLALLAESCVPITRVNGLQGRTRDRRRHLGNAPVDPPGEDRGTGAEGPPEARRRRDREAHGETGREEAEHGRRRDHRPLEQVGDSDKPRWNGA